MTTQRIYLEGNPGTGWQFAGACKTVDEAQSALALRRKDYPDCQWRIVYPTESGANRSIQHSPLPWCLSAHGNDFDILDNGRHYVAISAGASDAQFIVTACNSHAALVEALEGLLEFADNSTPIHPGSDVIAEARAALNLAKGGK